MSKVSEQLRISGKTTRYYNQRVSLQGKSLQSVARVVSWQGSGARLLAEKGLCFRYLKMFLYFKNCIVMFLWLQVV